MGLCRQQSQLLHKSSVQYGWRTALIGMLRMLMFECHPSESDSLPLSKCFSILSRMSATRKGMGRTSSTLASYASLISSARALAVVK
jgi:hypothetical protein